MLRDMDINMDQLYYEEKNLQNFLGKHSNYDKSTNNKQSKPIFKNSGNLESSRLKT